MGWIGDLFQWLYMATCFGLLDDALARWVQGYWYWAGVWGVAGIAIPVAVAVNAWIFVFGPAAEFVFDQPSEFPLTFTNLTHGLGEGFPGVLFGALVITIFAVVLITYLWPVILTASMFTALLFLLRALVRTARRTIHLSDKALSND